MTSCHRLALLALVLATGCSGRASDSGPSGAPGASAAAKPAPAHAAATSPAATGAVQTVTGTVEETMNASSYTYVRVKTGSGDVWAAASQFPVNVGDRVTVPLESPMQNFHSQSLNRDFPIIYFASRISREGDAPAASPHGAAAPSETPTVTESIQAPPNGMAIAKVWADRQSLAGKPVTVRGKVVKFNGGIMGKNWIHIQDGSGKAADGSNDLTLTTNDEVKVGDVITATGTVTIDKDFGAGYRYAVILEGATVSSKPI